MGLLRVTENELARDLPSILRQVETGVEIVVERNSSPVAVIRGASLARRKISECIELMPGESTGVIDADFPGDVEAAIAAHREPLEPPVWD